MNSCMFVCSFVLLCIVFACFFVCFFVSFFVRSFVHSQYVNFVAVICLSPFRNSLQSAARLLCFPPGRCEVCTGRWICGRPEFSIFGSVPKLGTRL